VEEITRPLRRIDGAPAVKYKKQLWRLKDGCIELQDGPIGAEAPKKRASTPTILDTIDAPIPAIPDDSNERQLILAAPASARLLVDAGPGTGKTHIAALRLARLIEQEVSPGQILVLSFSRGAVRTLTRRLTTLVGASSHVVEELRYIAIRTFDSWAFRILRLMDNDPRELLRRPHDENIAHLVQLLGSARAAEVRDRIGDRRHLIVDEFQDLPGVRGELVLALLELLAPPGQAGVGFTILGDPAQAIYGFAAGNAGQDGRVTPLDYWNAVRERYGAELAVRILTKNYRAAAPLADLSARLRCVLLGNFPDEAKLAAVQEAVSSLPELQGGFSAVDVTAPGSTAILTRTNGEALRVLQAVLGWGIQGPAGAVRLRAGGYVTLPPPWIAGLLRKVRSPSVVMSQFSKIYEHLTSVWDEPVREKLGLPTAAVAWERLARASGQPEDATSLSLAELRSRLTWPDSFPDDQPLVDDALMITTVHQSKGSEFDVVTILESAAREANFREDDEDVEGETTGRGVAEAANVGYVALTRAAGKAERAASTEIKWPPKNRKFKLGRTRLCYWWRCQVNMEIGQRGDIDPISFVDPALHGGREQVEELQSFLLQNARALEGRKVLLCIDVIEKRAYWNIHLQTETGEPGRLLGRTAQQLTEDILHLLHNRGYKLPGRIFNLRISAVGTVTSDREWPLEEPDRSSRLWLGVGLFGTGDFKPKKRQ
jgi:hypothetical protein